MITHTVLSVTFDIQQKDRVLEFLHFETVKRFQFTVGAALKKSMTANLTESTDLKFDPFVNWNKSINV